MIDRPRLEAVLGKVELAWLLDRLERRLARGRPLTGTIRCQDPTPQQREAVDRLLGRTPSRGRSVGVPLERLEATLRRARICADLRQAVEALRGPVPDQGALARQRDRAWNDLLDDGDRRDPRPEVRAWWRDPRTSDMLRRVTGGDPEDAWALADRAFTVIARLPAEDIPLQTLAAQATGDSHALDRGRALSTLTWNAAAHLAGLERGTGADRNLGAERWREVWKAVGVHKNDLSASALALGLTAGGSGLTDRVLRLHAEAGEPCRLTTGQLRRHPPTFDAADGVVHICENPAVLRTAAQRFGNASAPLVCVEGRPRIAVHRLLGQLETAGARLLYHGDFDWPGLAIAAELMSRHTIEPWRFTARDYLQADGQMELYGDPVASPWDPDLAVAMRHRGVVVHEEQVLEDLLHDLDRRCAGRSEPPGVDHR